MRKLLFTFLIVFSVTILNAQYVNIPDPNFVTWLNNNGYASCMSANQMDTTCTPVVNAVGVDCRNSNINDLTGISYFDNLDTLICQENQLTTLPALPIGLRYLYCAYNSITVLPALNDSLNRLACSYNQLTNLPSLPDSLIQLYCDHNFISVLPVLPDSLQILNCGNNPVSSISNLPLSVVWLEIDSTLITVIPPLPVNMIILNISGNPGITCLPPFATIAATFNWGGTSITCMPNTITWMFQLPNPAIDTVPLCDVFNNSNNCFIGNRITGTIYKDEIANCVIDVNDSLLNNISLSIYKNNQFYGKVYSSSGFFQAGVDTGNYEISVDTISFTPASVICPISNINTSALPNYAAVDSLNDFGVTCNGLFDIGIRYLLKDRPFFPGDSVVVSIIGGDLSNFYNLRCATGISGTLQIIITGPVTYVSPAAGALTPIVNFDTLTYIIPDFGLVNYRNDFKFILLADSNAQTGQQVCFDVEFTPVIGDAEPSNNLYSTCAVVGTSLDPNRKDVIPDGIIDSTSQWLTYTVHFQNTGNAPAQDIYILDTLSTNVDASSFQLLYYSHQPLTQLTGRNIRFNFPNINLPDSTNDEPNSHGFVQYRVKTKPGLQDGTEIRNTAYIYFDFNAPVVTNTTINTIDIVNGIQQQTGGGAILVYPNPFSSSITMESSELIISVQLFDITGRMVYHSKYNRGSRVNADLTALPDGLYVLEISTAASTERKKIVKR